MNATLPDEIQALKALALEQQNELAAREARLAACEAEIEHLKLVIAKLRRMEFGRRSERMSGMIGQLERSLEELEERRAEAPSHPASEPSAEGAPASHHRLPLPAHLPRERVEHLPEGECCPACGGALTLLGEDISEQLEYVPARFRVIRHVRPKLACTKCDAIVQAPAPSRPIMRGMAGAGLLAHVLVAKYADHLPLYRQSEIYTREGVELSRSTRSEWVGQCHALLCPLVEQLKRHVLAAGKLHADDTPVPVLAPGQGQTRTGRLWTYVRDDRLWGDDPPLRCGLPTRPIDGENIPKHI
jgi:transposase